MSHFSVTVAVSGADADEAEENIKTLLAPFDENLEVARRTKGDEIRGHKPNAKWDWYQIGGRWSGELRLRSDAAEGDYARGERSWTGEDEPPIPGTCDLARIRALDLAGMRDAAAADAVDDWNEYAAVVHGTPQHLPWQMFVDRVEAAAKAAPRPKAELEREALDAVLADLGLADIDAALQLKETAPDAHAHFLDRSRKELDAVDAAWQASTYTIQQARTDYAAQPRIAKLRAHEGYQGFFLEGPEDIFDHLDRDEYVALQRAQAVPGFATLTHQGQWIEKGRMGWFGMSDKTQDSTTTYLDQANTYLDSLPGDLWLAIVDCHI
ncbi:hypothetical protein [Amycolatopsis magusensis]|uniref:hypothetical protein n=1 Tax=Amycolatopsis magusensis TaxID=882444 RepID=UPI0037A2DBB8